MGKEESGVTIYGKIVIHLGENDFFWGSVNFFNFYFYFLKFKLTLLVSMKKREYWSEHGNN